MVDQNKLDRQEVGIQKWKENKGWGIWEWATAVGKTYAAVEVIKRMIAKNPTTDVIIIVPKVEIKKQWDKLIIKHKFVNVSCHIINGFVQKEVSYTPRLLVLDEMHRYASEEFSRVFELVDCKYFLGLTATIDRLDGKHDMLLKFAPIIDTITTEDARRNGWVADYIEVNLGVDLSKEDKEAYEQLNKSFKSAMAYFKYDFDLIKRCSRVAGAKEFAFRNNLDYREVQKRAYFGMMVWSQRMNFSHTAQAKIEVVKKLIKATNYKTITFGQYTKIADELTKEFDSISVSYHTALPTVEEIETKVEVRKTEKGAKTLAEKKNGKYKEEDGVYKVFYKTAVKLGNLKLKEKAINTFKDNRFKKRVLNTAKALDDGFSVDDIRLGIEWSRSNNPTQHTQRRGRVLRVCKDKDGNILTVYMVNVYIRNTKDEQYLYKSQTDPKTGLPTNPYIKEMSNVEDVIELLTNTSYERDLCEAI